MKISKVEGKIICDVPGCGNLASRVIILNKKDQYRYFLCEECYKELKDALKIKDGANEKG